MKELSPEKKLRLEKLELLTYDVEVGNTHIVRKVKGTKLNRLSLKSWPKDYIDGFIPNDFRVQPTFLDELARMISIHVTANFLSKPHKEAA